MRQGRVGLGISLVAVTACTVPIDVSQDENATSTSSSGGGSSSGGSSNGGSSVGGSSSGGFSGGGSSGGGSSGGGSGVLSSSMTSGSSGRGSTGGVSGTDGGVLVAGVDPAFGTQGILTFQQSVLELLPRPDGTLLVATYDSTRDAGALVQLQENGAVDTSFGTSGVAPLQVNASQAINTLKLWRVGSITRMLANVGTFNGSSWTHQVALATVQSQGTLADMVLLPGPQGATYVYAGAAAALPDGRWAVGMSGIPGNYVARGDAQGVDPAFGAGGYVAMTPGGTPAAVELWNGRVMVLRLTTDLNNDTQLDLVAHGPNGTLDASFGNGGVLPLCLFRSSNVREPVAALHADREGGLLVGVNCSPAGSSQARLMRLQNNGQPDTAFGTGGTVILAQPGAGTTTLGPLAQDGLGRLVVTGLHEVPATPLDPPQRGTFVTRLLSNGVVDVAAGNGGRILLPDVSREDPPLLVRVDVLDRVLVLLDQQRVARLVF